MKRKVTIAVGIVCAAALAGGLWAALADRHSAGATSTTGIRLDRALPNVPLLDEHGHAVTLGDYRGKVVVLSPTLTLCHEVCPLTTGAFTVMREAVRRAGLGDRVVFAEISVDPWRDSPARLRAFARYADVRFTVLTGTAPNLRRFWRLFGVGFFKTPQGTPPDVDWWTHRPETFDVAHTDGLFFVDGRGHLRIAVLGMPNVHGQLAAKLRGLLSDKGLANLRHPQAPWTIPQALDDLGSLLGRRIEPPVT
jgi:cytochrome oxidase Cu insertion factor (SCO1/SenC/PrrC family)